jgi:hypothetical protein
MVLISTPAHRYLAVGIRDILPSKRLTGRISEEDVLLDVPRRPMDSGGTVLVSLPGSGNVPLVEVSEPIRAINTKYDRLAKRARASSFLLP